MVTGWPIASRLQRSSLWATCPTPHQLDTTIAATPLRCRATTTWATMSTRCSSPISTATCGSACARAAQPSLRLTGPLANVNDKASVAQEGRLRQQVAPRDPACGCSRVAAGPRPLRATRQRRIHLPHRYQIRCICITSVASPSGCANFQRRAGVQHPTAQMRRRSASMSRLTGAASSVGRSDHPEPCHQPCRCHPPPAVDQRRHSVASVAWLALRAV